MTLDEYTGAVLPVIKAVLHLERDDDTWLARHLRGVFRSTLYGYGEGGFGKRYASEAAQTEYERLGNSGRITQWYVRQYHKFDKLGRMDGRFHLDHVFTNGMFDQALRSLPQECLNEKRVNEIVKNDYAVAWITRDENYTLNAKGYKSNRGNSLADALRVYNSVGIRLIDEDGIPVPPVS
jgi:hypothetical protein